MTDAQKNEIVLLIQEHKDALGSAEKVAKKCGVSAATISNMVNGQWESLDNVWFKVATALGWQPSGWQVTDTFNLRLMTDIINVTKTHSRFQAVSCRAGSGKTAALKHYTTLNRTKNVFFLSCRVWAKREFLTNLAQSLGIAVSKSNAVSADDLLMEIVNFFHARRNSKPILILDEADKLRSSALLTLITLFNECEDGLGLLIAGTEHLEKQMRSDARSNRKGGDELLSRFGGYFHKLIGATEADVKAIAMANGLNDASAIKAIWKECKPVQRSLTAAGKITTILVCEDYRIIKSAIRRELMRLASTVEAVAG